MQEHLGQVRAELGPGRFKSYVPLRVTAVAAKDLVIFECLQGPWAPSWGCCMSVGEGREKVGLGMRNLDGRHPGRQGTGKNKMKK